MRGMKKKTGAAFPKKRDVPKEKIYTSKEIETSIAILESTEINVVTEALLFLSKYADVRDENLLHLHAKGIVPKLFGQMEKSLAVRRLSLRLLSMIVARPVTHHEFLIGMYDDDLLAIEDTFVENTDVPTREFCAAILAKLAQSLRIVLLIFRTDLFRVIFQTMRSSTNTILLMNVLELFNNILEAPTAISLLSVDVHFEPSILMQRLNKFDDPEVATLILTILRKLTRVDLDQMMMRLKTIEVVENMFKIILDIKKEDFHPLAFDILTNCIKNPITNSYFIESIEFLEFCKWAKYCPNNYLPACALVLEKVTSIPSLKQTLFDLSIEDSVLYLLRSKDKEVLALACRAISNLSSHRFCCEKMLTPVVFREILNLAQLDQQSPTYYNQEAIQTLSNFCSRSARALNLLEAFDGVQLILKYFYSGLTNIPLKSFVQVLQILVSIVACSNRREKLMDANFYTALIDAIQFEEQDSQLLCLEIMTYCIANNVFRQQFVTKDGVALTVNLMKTTKNKFLMNSLLIFIHNKLMYDEMVHLYARENLAYVLKNFPSDVKEEFPLINRCLELIYSICLPLKFHELGKLEVNDKIQNRFYLTTMPWVSPFPCLESLISDYMSTRCTVYLVDLSMEAMEPSSNSSSARSSSNKELTEISTSLTATSTLVSTDTSTSTSTLASGFGSAGTASTTYVARDPFLLDYLTRLSQKLQDDFEIQEQVKIIAVFVDLQMCGPKQYYTEPDKLHSFCLHRESLKRKLATNLIPIGFVRVGFHCERSLLFKTLCDNLEVPCRLVRGSASIYWNEVPLIQQGSYRGNLQYYVVDLVKHVGELYAVGSSEANCYCDINSTSL